THIFFFKYTPTTDIYTLSLHDALPILLKCNWTIRKRLPRCKIRLKKRLLAFSRRLHARIRKTRYMHKMRCLLINRRSLLLALRRSEERFSRNAETDLVCRLLLEKKKTQ